jgi:hypothetical protein
MASKRELATKRRRESELQQARRKAKRAGVVLPKDGKKGKK